MASRRRIKVLVVDDSAYNRKAISEILEGIPEVVIVGKAADGQEALQIALVERPDVITLDLEMPRMDGFAFLRLLMSAQPTPVIVISAYAEKENVFRALELGALDFVAKPTHKISPEIYDVAEEVLHKVRLAADLGPNSLHRLQSYMPADLSPTGGYPVIVPERVKTYAPGQEPPAEKIVVIAASTGGPATLTRILSALPADVDAGIAVAQHMPPRFTTTFSERLGKQCALRVTELVALDVLRRGTVYIAPGDRNLEVTAAAQGALIKAVRPSPKDKYVPSGDLLFRSAAQALRKNVLGVVLTGMGDDGAAGALAVFDEGGEILVESRATAVVDGMPSAALRAVALAVEMPAEKIAQRITQFARGTE
jgi:two-component system, chemotaxis family, protein-glutamate methylesterase/glutaminase